MEDKVSYPREKLNILLLEGIHPASAEAFQSAGYRTTSQSASPSESELLSIISQVHLLGIRSKTQISERILDVARNLLAIGCFCIGTDQVDLKAATRRGVPVFNAPFSNTRSVAELTMAEIVMLARQAAHKSMLLHQGIWEKSAVDCVEVRGKTLGIVGYGHIGSQVGVLAESFGMKVQFYDVINKLPLGNALPVRPLDQLLSSSDFVTLHVPDTAETKGMMGESRLSAMKRGACLLNLSRGSVVDLAALKEKLASGHIGGAALDVFPKEPSSNKEPFVSELCGQRNVILTPHIGGSTTEAQRNIGLEVTEVLVKFIENGSTTGAVNFPRVELPHIRDSARILNIHRNVPGVLGSINSIFADMNVNIVSQYLSTNEDVGYLIMEVDNHISRAVKTRIDGLETNIRTRLLF